MPVCSYSPAAGELIQGSVPGVKGNQVRIGTDAPEDIQIMREELLEWMQASEEMYYT